MRKPKTEFTPQEKWLDIMAMLAVMELELLVQDALERENYLEALNHCGATVDLMNRYMDQPDIRNPLVVQRWRACIDSVGYDLTKIEKGAA